jgi:adenosine deaminase CECR1
MVGADGQENIPHRAWVLMFENVLNEVRKDLKRDGQEDDFFGARVRGLSL